MTPDLSELDLSFVEPGLRSQVLHRIAALEEYGCKKGRAAREKACATLGVDVEQLGTLHRAWSHRRRVEDVALPHGKKSRPSDIDPRVVNAIGAAYDADPDTTIREIGAAAERSLAPLGLAIPSYPTVVRYVKERMAARGMADANHEGADLLIDLVCIDMPVEADGARLRPHLAVAFDAAGTPLALSVHPDPPTAREIGAIVDEAHAAAQPNSWNAAEPLVSLPHGSFVPELIELLVAAPIKVVQRELRWVATGRIVAAAFGDTLAGYTLRPKLVGRSRDRRVAGHHNVEACSAIEAAEYLFRVARGSAGGRVDDTPLFTRSRAAVKKALTLTGEVIGAARADAGINAA